MYFNDQIRQAVIKSFCRTNQQALMPGLFTFLTEHLPMMEYPHQRHVCRHIIATIGREALGSEWQPNDALMAKLVLSTATFIDEKDSTIKHVLESVFSCVDVSKLSVKGWACLKRLSLIQKNNPILIP